MPPAPKDPTARVVAEILDGRHDGRLKEIAEAMLRRQAEGHTQFVWRITLDGETWDRRSATAGELGFAEKATKIQWKHLDPANEIEHFTALVVGHLVKVHGMDLEAAFRKAESFTAADIEDAVDDYEWVSPPKASDSTTS